MVIWLSVVVAVVGVLAYGLSSNPKVQELGRIAYFAGLFVALLHLRDFVAIAR